jgi:hypothetical protein
MYLCTITNKYRSFFQDLRPHNKIRSALFFVHLTSVVVQKVVTLTNTVSLPVVLILLEAFTILCLNWWTVYPRIQLWHEFVPAVEYRRQYSIHKRTLEVSTLASDSVIPVRFRNTVSS